jgi:hypothetical protein
MDLLYEATIALLSVNAQIALMTPRHRGSRSARATSCPHHHLQTCGARSIIVEPTMKFVAAFLLVSIGACAAFQQPLAASGRVQPDVLSRVSMATAVADTTGLTMALVRKQIDRMTKENFSATLDTLEPFFLNDSNEYFYTKCMRRIKRNAKHIGVSMPEKYAHEAACTVKRRTKQDEYIKTKFPPAEPAAE